MTEDQKNNASDKPADCIIRPVSTTEYVGETTTDIPETIPVQSKTENINKEPIQVIVNIPKEENKTAITANRISIIGTIINLALAGLTYMLFQKTIEANKTSQSSLLEAQKAVDQAKRANDIAEANFKLAQISSASSDSINNANLELSKKSVEAQINSIKESQNRFEIENAPFLQIMYPKIIPKLNEQFSIAYHIINISGNPAKITDMATFYSLTDSLPPAIPNKIPKDKFKAVNGYVIKETPIEDKFTFPGILRKREYDMIVDRKAVVYFYPTFNYINLATNKKRTYKCGMKLVYISPEKTYVEYIYNENHDVD
jgi:hypothetical protein